MNLPYDRSPKVLLETTDIRVVGKRRYSHGVDLTLETAKRDAMGQLTWIKRAQIEFTSDASTCSNAIEQLALLSALDAVERRDEEVARLTERLVKAKEEIDVLNRRIESTVDETLDRLDALDLS